MYHYLTLRYMYYTIIPHIISSLEPIRHRRRNLDGGPATNSGDINTINMSSLSTVSVNLLAMSSVHVLAIGTNTAIVGHTHLAGESGVRPPRSRVSWRLSLFHHSVDLFEGQTLGLPDEEVGVEHAQDTGRSPEEEDLGAEVLGVSRVLKHDGEENETYGLVSTDEVRGDNGEDTVPEPVGSGGKTNTSRSDRNREDFTDNLGCQTM
jgi:hypothetical protein